jgi:hypothetical protein
MNNYTFSNQKRVANHGVLNFRLFSLLMVFVRGFRSAKPTSGSSMMALSILSPQRSLQILFFLALLLFSTKGRGQNFSDNATNYGDTWSNGSNQGTGFGAWSLSAGANSGSFIGNPSNNGMGTSGIGTKAFGLFASGSAYMNASRPFSAAMEVGDKFTFYWAINWDANGGGKGFDFKNGSTTIFTVLNSGSSAITAGGVTADANYGTTPMLVTLIRTSSTQYSFSMTSRSGGSTYNATISSSSAVNAVNFFIGNQNNGDGNRNMYFNDLQIEKARYRSKVASGNWNATTTWEVSSDGGSTWGNANATPTSAHGPITILNGHTVTVSAAVTVDQVTVNAGGQITVNGGTFTIANGTGTDLDVNGTVKVSTNSVSLNASATMTVGNGGIYEHNRNFVNGIPTATWSTGSTCKLTGASATPDATIAQSFHDLTVAWSDNTVRYFGANVPSAVNGTLKIESGIIGCTGSASTNSTITVNNLLMTGGGITLNYGTNNSFSGRINVNGNVTLEGGTLRFSAAGTGVGWISCKGNLTIESATTISGFANSTSGFLFNGTGSSLVYLNAELSSSIRTRFWTLTTSGPSSVSEIYGGNSAQNTISGTTLPPSGYSAWPTSGSLLSNLTINNSAGVTLSTTKTVNGTLTLSSGTFTLTNALTMANASNIIRTGGSLSTAPTFGASVNVTYGNGSYSSAITTGSELPTSASVLNNLTINASGGVTLNAAAQVNGTLTLTSGILTTTTTNKLTIANTASGAISGGSATSYINGPLDRTLANGTSYTFPVGGSTSNYRPISLNSVSATGNPVVRITVAETGATTVDGTTLSSLLNARNWRIEQISGTFTSATLVITESGITNGTHEIGKSNSNQAGTYVSCGTPQTVSTGTITSPSAQGVGFYAIGVLSACTNPTNGGTIAADQTICSGGDPAAFTSSVAASGNAGTLEYKWQYSSSSNFSSDVNDIASSNSETYDAPSGLTSTRYYRRLARVSCSANWSGAVASNILTVTVNANNTVGAASSTPTLCINSALTNITHTTTGATGIGTATGLPTGLSAAWASNTITISGTPTESGSFSYSIPLTGGCGSVNATGSITVTAANTASAASSTPTLCINTALTNITHTTTGATGIGTATGLPTGVTAGWASNTITISGTPTQSGSFSYSIPLTGGCGSVNATGSITVTAANTAGAASSTPTLCVNTALTNITHSTTGATGIGTATGLPSGVSASWASNTITISGTPTQAGTFSYSIPLTGGCGSVNATGTITVNSSVGGTATATASSVCLNGSTSISLTGNTGTIQWQRSEDAGTTWSNISGATSSTYTTPNLITATSYRAVVTNGSCASANSTTAAVSISQANTSTASASTYNSGWSNTQNDNTTGLGAWSLSTTGTAGFFTGSSDINNGGSRSWGMYANAGSGNVASAVRTVSMSIGNTVSYSMDNGFIDGTIGFALQNASGENLMELLFISGQSFYQIFDAAGTTNTTIGYTSGGIDVSVAYTGINTYTINITGKGGVTASYTSRTFSTRGGGQVPAQIRFFSANNGTGPSYDLFFNSLSISNPVITAHPSTGTQSVCQNGSATALSVTASGSTPTYQWYSNTTASNSGGTLVDGATSSSYTPSTTTVGTLYYYCVVTNSTCGSATSRVSGAITITAGPNAGTLSGTQGICVGGTTTFTSNGNAGGTWSSGSTGVATINSSTGIVTGVAAGTATITYTVTGTGGCSNATATRDVTVTAAPNAGTLSGIQSICTSGTTTTTFTTNGNSGGTWSSGNTAVATVNSSTGVVTAVAVGTATITYTVTGTGGCSNATATRDVTVTTAPNAGTLSGTQAICVSGTTDFDTNGDAGGSWTSSNTGVATVNSSTGLVTGVAAGTATITYTVTGTGGCSNATATRTVTVSSSTTTITPSTTQNITIGINGTQLSVTEGTSSATSREWKYSETSGSGYGSFSPAQTGSTYTPNFASSGTYYVVCVTTYDSPCNTTVTSNQVQINLTGNAITTSTINGSPFCAGATGISVPFTYSAASNFPNGTTTFKAQLSNASGVFTSPVDLQTTVSDASGSQSISVTIPSNTVTGSGYRIRVVSDNPAVDGADNGVNLTINLNTAGAASSTPTLCINTALTNITHTTTGATGIGTATGLPTGVTANWSSNTITISGTPTQSGTFNYSIPLTGGCGSVNATGTITVTADNTASSASSTPTLCINTALTNITHTTTGATGIGTATGLPTGVTANWSSNTITISGTPSQSGSFNYSIPLTGGCGSVNATGTITVTAANTAGAASSTPTLCINTALTNITHSTTGATGIGSASGLPSGVSAAWASNTITISGTPTQSGTFSYSIPLTGGCGSVNATGTITVTAANTAGAASSSPTLCINTALTDITHTTTGATGIGTATGLPTGVTAGWASNTITISGTPSQSGTFSYSIPLTGGCGSVNATGTITVAAAANAGSLSGTQGICVSGTTTFTSDGNSGGSWSSGNTSIATVNSSTGLVTGVAAGTATITYTVTGTGGCSNATATRTVTVTTAPNAGTLSGTQGICIGGTTTFTSNGNAGGSWTSGNTGVATVDVSTGVVTGVAAGTATITYTVTGSGGCSNATATRTVTVSANNTAGSASSTPTLCINTALTNITHFTTGATGIGTASGLPTGVTANWSSNTITISGTPSQAGSFSYTIPLTGGCGSVNATGSITVNSSVGGTATATASSVCLNGSTSISLSGNTGTIQWQRSENAGTSWSDITGATSASYNTPNLITATSYRAVVTNGSCTAANSTTASVSVAEANSTNASASTYNSGWSNTQNDNTTGLGPWSLSTTGTAGFFTGSSDINNGGSRSWGMYASGGSNVASAVRTASMSIGNTISFSMDNGSIDNGKVVGFGLQNASGENLMELLFIGGQSFYQIIDAAGTTNTSIGYTSGGLDVSVVYSGVNTYAIHVTGKGGATASYTARTFSTQSGGQVPAQIRFFNAGAGGGGSYDLFFNSLSISNPVITAHPSTGTQTVCQNGSATALSVTASGSTPTYQWYSNTTASNSGGTLIDGATLSTYTPSTTSASALYYYCVVTNSSCGSATSRVSGLITVTATNTAGAASSTPTLCINTALTNITHTTTGATGIGSATGLPAGVTAAWASNTITISGTPTAAGTFSYSIPLTGGCGTVNATGTITVTAANTAGAASSTPTVCTNTAITAITHTTTGATGIGSATGLPSGVTASWASNTITISGTPTAAGTYSYTIPLTGGCGSVNAIGTITVTTPGTWVGGTSTDWNTAANWTCGVPTSTTDVTIPSGTTFSPSITSANADCKNITINSGATLTMANAYSLTIASGSTFTNNGTFTRDNGTVVFSGSGTIAGTVIFNNLTLNGAVTFGSAVTIDGTLQLNSSSSIETNSPIYTSNSTLTYNTTGTYGRSREWNATGAGTIGTTAGYPNNVTISNNTTLNYPNSAPTVARAIEGNLTINSGSALNMAQVSPSTSAALTVKGNLVNSGTLTLGDAAGGNLNLGGNFTSAGTFTANSRAVTLNGSTGQTINSAVTFADLTVSNSAGVTLGAAVTVSGTLTFSSGSITLGTNNLTASGTISGASATNHIVTNSTGYLIRNVSSTEVTFPVGTGSSYAPAHLTQAGTAENISVRVKGSIDNAPAINSNAVVNLQWTLNEATAGSNNLTTKFQWNASNEGSAYLRAATTEIAQWSTSYTRTAASVSGSDPYHATSSSGITANINAMPFIVANDFAFTAVSAQYRSRQTGNWNNFNTWERSTNSGATWANAISGQTPSSSDGAITIQNGHTVTITAGVTIDQVTIDNGGTVVHSAAATVTLNNGTGTDLTINGTWKRTSNNFTISISSGADISVGSTGIYEHAITASGGSIPYATWNSSSILRIMNDAGMTSPPTQLDQTFGIVEINCSTQTSNWSIDGFTDIVNELRVINTGSGYVSTNSNKTLSGNLVQSGGRFINGVVNVNTSLTISGNLTVSGGSFEVAANISTSYTYEVFVNGNVLINGGTIDLNKAGTSNANSGRLYIGGDFTISSGSLARTQTRTDGSSGVYFYGNGAQSFTWSGGTIDAQVLKRFYYKITSGPTALNETYSASSAQTTINGTEGTPASGYAAWPTSGSLINNLTINNSAGVTMSTSKEINGALTMTSGKLAIGANNTLILDGTVSGMSATNSITGSASSNLTIGGTGSLGTLFFDQGTAGTTNNIAAFTMNRTSSGTVTLGNDMTVGTSLALTSGLVTLGSSNLQLGSNASVSGTPSASNMIVAEGSGQLRKVYGAAGTFTFPVGDATGTTEYSPVAVNVTGGTGFGASTTISVNLADAKHPNNASGTNFLTRYWNVTQSGITNCVATITGTYTNSSSDVSGTLASIKAAQLNGTFNQSTNPWVKTGGSVLSGTALTYTGATLTSGTTSVFTGITSADPTVTISGATSVCTGGSVTLTANPSGDASFTYSWSGSLGTSQTATPSTSSAGSTDYTVTVRDGNGISATSAVATVAVIAQPSITTQPAGATICLGGTYSPTVAAIGGTPSLTYQWQYSADGTNGWNNVANGIPTNATYSNAQSNNTFSVSGSIALGTYYYRCIVSASGTGCASANSDLATLTISPNTWTGTTSKEWNNSANWTCGVPDANSNIVISTSSPNAPELDVDYTLPSGKTLTISETGSLTIGSQSKLTIAGTADFGGKSVVMKSDSLGTAILGQVTGTLLNANNVTVERYIPKGKRAFRFLTTGVTTTNFIRANWQNNGVYTPNIGTHITGSSSALGFDATTLGNPSMFYYNNQVTSGSGWTQIPNTHQTNLLAGMGYRILIRGDRTSSLLTTASQPLMNVATTLSATGTLTTGTVTYNSGTIPAINTTDNSTTNGYSLIGNPYVSPIDWHAVTLNNVENYYYTWDPNMGSNTQRGRYVAYEKFNANSGATTVQGDGTSQVNRYIQPGQAFFVKTSNRTNPSITFEESDKASTFRNVFREETPVYTKLNISLFEPAELGIGGYALDGVVALYGDSFSNTVGIGDVPKMEAGGENLAIFGNNLKWAMQGSSPIQNNDELLLKTLRLVANKNYTFKINAVNLDASVTAYLVDNFLATTTSINLTQDYFGNFSTTSVVASYSEDRFKIVFKVGTLATPDFESSIGLYPNPSTTNAFYLNIPNWTDDIKVKLHNAVGQEMPLEVSTSDGIVRYCKSKIDLAAGMYIITITKEGSTVNKKWLIQR